LISNADPNLGSLNDESVAVPQYADKKGEFRNEYLLNEFATNVLAASYDPVIARKLLKLVKELKKAVAKMIDTPETIMAKTFLMAKDKMDRQEKQPGWTAKGFYKNKILHLNNINEPGFHKQPCET
jgi:hypothetical protein